MRLFKKAYNFHQLRYCDYSPRVTEN